MLECARYGADIVHRLQPCAAARFQHGDLLRRHSGYVCEVIAPDPGKHAPRSHDPPGDLYV
jgi:hypothetical protein